MVPDYLKDCIVNADSVEDFIKKYYKPNRVYPELLQSCKEDLKERGYVCISRHSSLTGEFICCIPKNT